MHLMINRVKGVFEQFQATVSFDPDDLATTAIQASIDANSITTRQSQRDAHLKSEDFFHVAKYPDITFHSTGCTQVGAKELEIAGDLTLHGVTKSVTFHTMFGGIGTDPRGRERVGLMSTAVIHRDAFGLSFNSPLETGGIVVANEVKIELCIEAIKAGQASMDVGA